MFNTIKSLFTKRRKYIIISLTFLFIILIGLFTFFLYSDTNTIFSNAASRTSLRTFAVAGKGAVANEDGPFISIDSETPWIGTGENTSSSYLGLIVTGTSAKAINVRKAYLEVTSHTAQWIPLAFDITLENTGEPAIFSSSNPPSKRSVDTTTRTSLSSNDEWKAGEKIRFDVTKQVNLWKSRYPKSNRISFIIKGTGDQWARKALFSSGISLVINVNESTLTPTTNPTHATTPSSTVSPTSHATHSPTPTTVTATTSPNPTATIPVSSASNSVAMGKWSPNVLYDTCPNAADTARIKEIHDSYSVIGPDGKRYPTWHPPVDPKTGCKFGHEHGRDPVMFPNLSSLKQMFYFDANKNGLADASELSSAGIPFGYVNETLDVWNAANNGGAGMRHEDHVGHKIEWEINVPVQGNVIDGQALQSVGYNCNYFAKVHQGTSTPDAFKNNIHEVYYYSTCGADHELKLMKMVDFGKAGEFTQTCKEDRFTIITTSVDVVNKLYPGSRLSGERGIPTRDCMNKEFLVPQGKWSMNLYEAWTSNMNITKADGTKLTDGIDLLFDVNNAVRFFDPTKPNNLGYSMDLCYEIEPNGDTYRGGPCDIATNYGAIKGIKWDDPRTAFKGTSRGVYFKPGDIRNSGGSTVWYTDPFGRNAKTTPFAGSIKQFVLNTTVDWTSRAKSKGVSNITPTVINRQCNKAGEVCYNHPTIHGPN
jgi:hypothetical protein